MNNMDYPLQEIYDNLEPEYGAEFTEEQLQKFEAWAETRYEMAMEDQDERN